MNQLRYRTLRCRLVAACALATAVLAGGPKNFPWAKFATAADQEAAKTPAANQIDLNGVWRGFVVFGKGENPNRGTVHLEIVVKDNKMTAHRLDGQQDPLGQGTVTIQAGRNFWEIDAVETRARGKGRKYLGIARFGPDLMRWCVANPGNARPTTLETKGQQFLLVMKRQRPQGAAPAKGPAVRPVRAAK